MSDAFVLNCDDDPRHVFSVGIAVTESVSALRKAIKVEKKPAFDHIPADTLVLWSVSIPVDKSFKDSLNDFEPADEESLLPVDRVSEVFVNVPEKRRLHIIVKAPPIGACV